MSTRDPASATAGTGATGARQTESSPDPDLRSISGWGGSSVTTSEVVTPESMAQILEVKPRRNGWIARGLGRSYGDAAQLSGGTVVDMTRLTGIHLDIAPGVLTARAGTSLGEILDLIEPRGWFLPVMPGTRQITVGGAIASDVHGKNHHRDGSFANHILSLDLITGDGRVHRVTPGSEVFAATLGGMGLTGIITTATFQLIPISSRLVAVDTTRASDLLSVIQELYQTDVGHRYSAAWIDLSPHGKGRGVVVGGDHVTDEQAPRGRAQRDISLGRRINVPDWSPAVVNDLTVTMFNELWYRRAPRRQSGRIRSLSSFFNPLDRLSNWNRLYGRQGLLQYQFVVPMGEENTLVAVAEMFHATPTPVSLAVLKRMGPASGGMLSFPMPGWTLALDLPLGDPDLADVLDRCDEMIARAGGRVYLAKDSRLRQDLVEAMYPGLPAWREIRAGLDPDKTFRSNLSERLALTG